MVLDDSLKRWSFPKKIFWIPQGSEKEHTKTDPQPTPLSALFLFFMIRNSGIILGVKVGFLVGVAPVGVCWGPLKDCYFDCWYITVDWSETKEKEERHAGASV